MDRRESSPLGGEAPSPPAFTPIGTPSKMRAERSRIREDEEQRFRPDIYWYLTFQCNLACAHCWVQSSPQVDSGEDLRLEECMRVVEQMAELDVRSAILTGGEVMIRPDVVKIMRALGEKGIHVGLETNGLRFDREFAAVARELQAKNLFHTCISLDGGTAESHERIRGPRSFERTVRGLRFLKEQGIRFHVQCVLTGANYRSIPALYALARDLSPEFAIVQWALLNPLGRGKELNDELGLRPEDLPAILESIRKAKKDYSGYTLINVPPALVPPRFLPMVFKEKKVKSPTCCLFPLLGVLPNGDVTVCAITRDQQALCFGNIRDPEVNLKEIWERSQLRVQRRRYMEAQELKGICADCIWKYSCKGSCRAWAYQEQGSFDAPFPICKALDEAGAFPKIYRLSHQNAAAIRKFQQMQAPASGTLPGR